ncbi:fimbrial protein [Kluyvera intermedia]|jgi:minor fimbrial subunit|uniref:Fimbrial protein n=1 Tax=Kluyvera intermedia TaxID=61648 RepID=A0ABX6DPZ3_KLUIN|nr:fimbrial protein [Kluyvera intermedia]QGH29839.1 fimbrial protein [Kluyvera intermedia]QGH38821.1 fimbrial protein [Kluyvera intermedia]WEJ85263.1 MAG: fimbrial protein [Kluyvera intermedia]
MKMKLPWLVVLLLQSMTASAYECASIDWHGGNANININISSDVNTGKNRIVDLAPQITCKNTAGQGGWTDTMWLGSDGVKLNSSIFKNLRYGVTIYGNEHPAPVSETKIFDLDNGESKPLPVVLYFELTSLGEEIHIKAGDQLGSIRFVQTNNHGDRRDYTWTLFAANDADINTSTCKVLSGSTFNVDLGKVERGNIASGGTSSQTIIKDFNIVCDAAHVVDFDVRMSLVSPAWNNKVIKTSNDNLGIEMRWNGAAVSDGVSQKLSVMNGSATVPLSFTPVKPPSLSFNDIATGAFTASATMILTQY